MANSFSEALWSKLFYTYLAIAIVVGALVIGWLLLSLWRYRARPGAARPADAPIAGTVQPERGTVLFSWILALTIAAIMFGLAFSTIHAVDAIENAPPDEPALHVNVTAFQFGFKYNYTGEGGVPVQTVTEWTVPVNTVVVMNVTSQDVWHNYALPNYRIRVDAIPGEVNHLWFKAYDLGDERNVCVQICGSGHGNMKAVMHVVSQADFDAFLHKESQSAYAKLAKKTLVNATYDGASFVVDGKTGGAAGALNVTNNGGSAATFHLQGYAQTVTVQPGQSGFLYVPAHSGTLTLVGPNANGEVS